MLAAPLRCAVVRVLTGTARTSLATLQTILTAEGGQIRSLPGSFIQAAFPFGTTVYAVLAHVEPGESPQRIYLFCLAPRGGADAICRIIQQRYNAP